MLSAADNKMHM